MKAIKIKKAVQLKLSSMSEHWAGNPPKKSGKHRSQEMQRLMRKRKNKTKPKPTLHQLQTGKKP
jgi:hypothetical protein